MSLTIQVAVTGASGYIAGHLIEQLINAGFKVNGTVRSLEDTEKIKHLQERFGSSLSLFEADLLQVDGFVKAFQGCSAVFHTASPFQLVVEDPQRDLIDPALSGTLNVLEAARRLGILRVILTSSIAAIVGDSRPADDKVFTEEDWNLESTLSSAPYRLSKRLAEEAAWDFAKRNEMNLTTICPSFVLGPAHSTRIDSTSIKTIKNLLEGKSKAGAGSACYALVDVRDVANAHLQALLNNNSQAFGQRYIVASEQGYDFLQVSQFLREIILEDYPQASSLLEGLPTTFVVPPTFSPKLSTAKLQKDLAVTVRHPKESLRDMLRFLFETQLVTLSTQ